MDPTTQRLWILAEFNVCNNFSISHCSALYPFSKSKFYVHWACSPFQCKDYWVPPWTQSKLGWPLTHVAHPAVHFDRCRWVEQSICLIIERILWTERPPWLLNSSFWKRKKTYFCKLILFSQWPLVWTFLVQETCFEPDLN